MLKGGVVVLWLSLVPVVLSKQHTIQLPSEWHSWKVEHGKRYDCFQEELQRHVMWKANQQYIDAHNAHEDIFGFALRMNQFGDLVRCLLLCMFYFSVHLSFCQSVRLIISKRD